MRSPGNLKLCLRDFTRARISVDGIAEEVHRVGSRFRVARNLARTIHRAACERAVGERAAHLRNRVARHIELMRVRVSLRQIEETFGAFFCGGWNAVER